jgi:vancomycin resistance protein YoaR
MAVSEQVLDREDVLERRRAHWFPRPGRKLVLFVATMALGAGAVVGGLALFHEQGVGRILPGVSIAGIDVGGLTPDDARTSVAARLADLSAGSVLVRSGIGSTSVAFTAVRRVPLVDAMVADATARGRGGTWLDETIAAIRLRLHPEDVALRLDYDHDAAAAAVRALVDRSALRAIDASVVGGGSGGFGVTSSVDGWTIDEGATVAALDGVMRDPASRAGTVVRASVTRAAPVLSTDDAAAVKAAADRVAAVLQVRANDRTWKISTSRIRSWISFAWVDGQYRVQIDRSRIPEVFKNIATSVARPVLNAEFLRDKHGRIVGSKADRAGRGLDVDASVAAISAALEARIEAPSAPTIELAIATIAPQLTTEEAAKRAPLMVMVGSWTTYYQSSAHNGFSANITVPTRVLNGTVVAPGAIFDFWGGLGEVSLRTGYKLGGAIVGGHSVEGKALAGGICAASTTLFNAALRGGFEILTRQPHWYYITRYPLGLDATVSGSQTMRFRNDTASPILIRGFASPGIVRYEIWSIPTGRTVTLSRPQVSNVVPGADSEVLAPDLPIGTTERIEWPVDGKDVVVTRTVRDAAGHVIHSDTFVSHYHRMIGINRIGTGPVLS